ncbi:hypothetical protein GPJ56_004622 [Histomonas meleagridis]|uniref:uncharacterized protein n=1 Tax=Histomonas meleagridis TaxID=135588 RepID=UPI003559721E|nr:hypothetical protein GPJ56_004622 [Histomonas meleagridis]KAH0797383.1 hypothetical protein GO595_009704 [Histomonas meleagridis]
MLTVDRSPRANRQVWCKYCNTFVHNDIKSINHHNSHITHIVNVKKYEQKQKAERIHEQQKNELIDAELDIIRAKAQQQYFVQDVAKQNLDSVRKSQEEIQENIDIAKSLYGEEVFKELMEPKKKINKVDAYNSIMKSLPTRIPKKFRRPINEFKE